MTSTRLRSSLLAALAVGLSQAAFGCNFADTVLLWPPSGPAETNGAARRVIAADGKELEIWTTPPANGKKPAAYVLRFYGNGDRADFHVGEESSQFPDAEMWGVNYPGYGGSRGPATLRGVAAAAVASYDAVAAEARGLPILAFGSSLGTTAALHVAAMRNVHALLLVNPPPLRQLIVGEYGWWNLWALAGGTAAQVPAELDSLQNARNARMPAVFVMAEKDEVVPPEYQQQVIGAYAGRKEVIVVPGGTHNSGADRETQDKIVAAVTRLMRPVSPASAISDTSSESTAGSSRPRRSRIHP
jgi:uncharacterized protein